MKIEIISFGKITEFLPSGKFILDHVMDIDELRAYLERAYPQLAKMTYKLALNKTLVHHNMPLADGATIAIMPPFSGG